MAVESSTINMFRLNVKAATPLGASFEDTTYIGSVEAFR